MLQVKDFSKLKDYNFQEFNTFFQKVLHTDEDEGEALLIVNKDNHYVFIHTDGNELNETWVYLDLVYDLIKKGVIEKCD